MTRLNVANFWWALAGVLVMSNTNIWVERAFRAIGWFREEDEDGVENILTARTPSWWLQLVLFAILFFGVIFSAAMAGQLFLLISMATQSVLVMTIAACAAFVLLVAGVSWLVAEGLALDRRARFSLAVALMAILGIVLPAWGLILNPAPLTATEAPQPRPGTQYWDLSTGSHIAYSYFPAEGGRPRRNPIVFLHGGRAGPFSTPTSHSYSSRRRGSTSTCTIGRDRAIGPAVADWGVHDLAQRGGFEAIRETIQADRLILIAHEAGCGSQRAIWSTTGIASSAWSSTHPARCGRTSSSRWRRCVQQRSRPGPIRSRTYAPPSRWPSRSTAPGPPRPIYPESDTAWFDQIVDERMMVCVGQENLAPNPQSPGYNGYAQVVGEVTADEPPDPRPGMRQLLIPTILMRGGCDPIDASVVRQYQDAVAFLQVYEFPNAGGIIHLSDPEGVKAIILAFLDREGAPRL